MSNSSYHLYEEIVLYLRSDNVLKSSLNSIYEQSPHNAAMPYMYSHFHGLVDVGTFDKKTLKAELAFHIFCYNLQEVIRISARTRTCCIRFFNEYRNYILSDIKYRITKQEQYFTSLINLEVFIRGHSKVQK
ncbi:MAG: hypothetical protein AB8U44_04445 [Aaplasma endosymbiont of Hyalomma asiaticum]